MRAHIVRFLLGLALGAAGGLAYGWLLEPVEYVDTTPTALRADYRTDYVLMVAEAYQGDGDLGLAIVRLGSLGPLPPEQRVVQAIDEAAARGLPRQDLDRLATLADALRAASTAPEIPGP